MWSHSFLPSVYVNDKLLKKRWRAGSYLSPRLIALDLPYVMFSPALCHL